MKTQFLIVFLFSYLRALSKVLLEIQSIKIELLLANYIPFSTPLFINQIENTVYNTYNTLISKYFATTIRQKSLNQ